jgi:hypothetical protein
VLARPERFELPTYSSGGCRSIQLSYGRVYFSVHPEVGELQRARACGVAQEKSGALQTSPAIATASAALAAATASASATAAAFRLGTGFVHVQRSASQL